jgi:hypothetical protein
MIMLSSPHQEEVLQKKKLGGITLDIKLHLTTWRPTVEKAKLDIERFANSTHHIRDRVKHIHFLQRVIPGSVRTHDYNLHSVDLNGKTRVKWCILNTPFYSMTHSPVVNSVPIILSQVNVLGLRM